jgi:hypothetical protein
MKSLTIITFLFLPFFLSCNQKNAPDEIIVKEILTLTKEYNGAWDKLNMETVAKFHSDSNFRYYRYGTLAVSSNAEFRKMAPEWMKETKSLETIEFSEPVVQILSNNIAVIGFKGAARAVLKNGTEEIDSGAVTYVWQKINNQWKIVHIHESKK